MKNYLLTTIFTLIFTSACAKGVEGENNGSGGATEGSRKLYAQVNSKALTDASDQIKGDIIPDFSRVGYRWGDKKIPTVTTVKSLMPPSGGADARAMIQSAINEIAALPEAQRGAILLRKGLYNISDVITIPASGIVIRGEGNSDDPTKSTVIVATKQTGISESARHSLFVVGTTQSRIVTIQLNIKDNYVPVGQFWVRVNNANTYAVGENVTIYYEPNQKWITDLKMDQISDPATSTQWTPSGYKFHAERVITKIKSDTIWFENPVVLALDKQYFNGGVCKYNYNSRRPSEIGFENLFIKSLYDNSKKSGSDFIDENHAWTAIEFKTSEHCWVKGVTGKYFANALVDATANAKNISVVDCSHTEPVSVVTGGRRYIFCNDGQLSLFLRCNSNDGRHSFVASPRNSGPNAFVHCTETKSRSDCGPHHRWNMATLYDNLTTGEFNVQDRDAMGSGHGWSGVNQVVWNATITKRICVQSPWVSGRNFAIGVKGSKYSGHRPDRPTGYWSNQGTTVTPLSLYEAQLELRRKLQPGGVMDVD